MDFLKEEVEREELEAARPLAQIRLELGLNSLKLEMFSTVGAMDPAEKQELKQRFGREEVAETGAMDRDVFSLHLGGGGHPHTQILRVGQHCLCYGVFLDALASLGLMIETH